MTQTAKVEGIAHYLDARTEAAVLAALRHLAQTLRTGSDAVCDDLDLILSNCDMLVPLSSDEIDAFADALASDTWLCQTASPATGVEG